MNDIFQPRVDSSAPGAALSRARVAQNLSIIEVARHLKLTPAQVEALEAGDYERLPGRVFVRGFIKNYAKLVRLDPAPLLRQIESEIPQAPPVAEMRLEREVPLPVEKRSRWPVFGGVAFLIVAALAVYEFGFNDQAREGGEGAAANANEKEAAPARETVPPKPAPPPVAAPAAAPAVLAPPPLASAPPPAPTTAPSPLPKPAAEPQRSGSITITDTQPARGGRVGELHFRFDDESWVEVRDRENKVIFSKLNRAGAEERVIGMPPFRMTVGNARKVRVTYDQKPVDMTPHIGVTVARMTVE